MDKATIDHFKESHREINFKTNKATIDGIEYTIDKKSFKDGKVLLQLKKSDLIVPLSIPIYEIVSLKNQILLAFSTIDKRDSIIRRFKDALRIIKYFTLKLL